MNNIYYDLERILNGFSEDVLKELAKKLKRRIKLKKSSIIHEILSPPKGNRDDRVKVWQEVNRLLRKELEVLSKKPSLMLSLSDVPLNDQFKVSYMFTLSPSPEVRELGEKLYCQAKENKQINDKRDADELIAALTAKEEIESVETKEAKETTETIEIMPTVEIIEAGKIIETQIESSGPKKLSNELAAEELIDLHKRIKTLENKLSKAISEEIRTKEQFEKLKQNLATIKSQWVREKEETARYRNLVDELEVERSNNNKEIEVLKQKLEVEQGKSLPQKKAKEQSNSKELLCVTDKSSSTIDLAFYQGRKALIFAERDNEIDVRLNALGIIPIWAMEIDWNRPRRRMSTCEIVLYKKNNEKLQKLDEIRDIARYWNIPCNELLNI